jgi:hypothetical protein
MISHSMWTRILIHPMFDVQLEIRALCVLLGSLMKQIDVITR